MTMRMSVVAAVVLLHSLLSGITTLRAQGGVLYHDDFSDLADWEISFGERPPKLHGISGERYLPGSFPAANASAFTVVFPRRAYDTSDPGRRAEIKQHRYDWTAYGQERWYAFSIFVPEDYLTPGLAYHIVFQFHGSSDVDSATGSRQPEDMRSPPFMLGFESDGTWGGQIRFSANRYDQGNSTTTPLNIPWMESGTPARRGPTVRRGEWTHWVLNAIWDFRSGGSGTFRSWIKDGGHPGGELVFDYSGPTGFNDTDPPYTNLGIYYCQWDLSGWPVDVEELTLFYDRFIVGGGDASLETMMYSIPSYSQIVPPRTAAPDADLFPNPFRQTLEVKFPSTGSRPRRITVHDRLGRPVHAWDNSHLDAGSGVLHWTPRHLAPGIYYLRILSDEGMRALPVQYLR